MMCDIEEVVKWANRYGEDMWDKFQSCFKEVNTTNPLLNKLPSDIRKVLVTYLGEKSACIWIQGGLTLMDGHRAIDLVESEIGIKALKAFIITMPN